MDAWETLIANSGMESGDAWGHLNAQGAAGERVVVVSAFDVYADNLMVCAGLIWSAYDAMIDARWDVQINDTLMDVELAGGYNLSTATEV